ncbi:MAG: Swt1 family HEPN domain-containing protein [Candidatus Eremiobacterota bacterium]
MCSRILSVVPSARWSAKLRYSRNKWAHQQRLTSDDVYRRLDSTHRLLLAVSAPARGGRVGHYEDRGPATAARSARAPARPSRLPSRGA